MKKGIVFICLLFSIVLNAQHLEKEEINYKEMMYDHSYNFYEVVNAAESYFLTIDKDAKGSGWKQYQRWKHANEYKYYPDGNRSGVDSYFAKHQYELFMKNNPEAKSLNNGSWNDLGPYFIDTITTHTSPGLGRIEDFYVSPTNSNLIYLGSKSGGFWRTTDGGTTWSVTTDSLFACGVNAIAVSPTNSDSVLINVRNSRNNISHGLYRSTDGGVSWTQSNFNPTNIGTGGLGSSFEIFEIAYHPRVKDLIFIATNDGVYKSTNNLQTWTKVRANYRFTEIAFHPSNDNIIYLYGYRIGASINRVYRSTNQGASYSTSNPIIGHSFNTAVELVTNPLCDDCLWFASNNGVWVSYNSGLSFNFLSNSTQNCGGFAINDLDTSKMIYGWIDIDNSIDGGRTFVNRTRNNLTSTNGVGTNHHRYKQTSTNYVHADLRNAKAVNGVFYAATDGFLAKSTNNGVDWVRLSEGVGIRENYKLGVSQSNHDKTVCGSQDNGSSIYTKSEWIEVFGADGMECFIHPLNENWMVLSSQNGGRARITDGVNIENAAITPSGSSSADWEAPIAYNPLNPMTIYDFRNSVHKSNDFGTTYTQLGNPIFSGNIQQAAIAEGDSNIIVVSRNEHIEKSVNGGQTFTSIRANLPNSSIEDIAFDPNDDQTIIVVYASYLTNNQKVFITKNGGSSWTDITYNLGNMPIHSVVIDHTNSSNIYLGAEIGVYTKAMNSTNWSLYSKGLPNVTIEELEINHGSNTLRAASWGRGLWEYNLVGRANYPAIMHTTITNPPDETNPKFSKNQSVTSKINYTGNLTDVYVEWSANSLALGNRITMSNTVNTTWVSNSAIPQLPIGTQVYFKVFAVGSNNDTTETYRFMYEVQPYTPPCVAIPQSGTGFWSYLANVNLRNLNNTSVNDGYTFYSNPVVELFADSTYTLRLMANNNLRANDFGAWIDYNNDEDFDSTEMVLFALNARNMSSNTFTVPSTANIGDTVKMRTRLTYFEDPVPCGPATGEVEDYLVVLNDVSTSIENVQPISSKILLYPNPNAGSFELDFQDRLTQQPIVIYDAQGRQVAVENQDSRRKIEFNLDLPQGTYFIAVQFKESSEIIPMLIGPR